MKLSAFAACVGLAGVACTFPEVTFEGGAGGGAGASGSGAPSSGSSSGSIAGSTGSAMDCLGPPWPAACDGDTDGFAKATCCNDPTKIDCDDTNGDVKPGQMMYFTMPRTDGSNSFDYNCDMNEEEEYVQAVCADFQCKGGNITAEYIFNPTATPGCGQAGVRIYCDGSNMCQQEGWTQACR